MNDSTKTTSNAITMQPSKSAGDWINRVIDAEARIEVSPAVERVVAVKAVKAKAATDVTDAVEAVEAVKGVVGRKAKYAPNADMLRQMVTENSIDIRADYPNIGMLRMAVSNKLRAAAKRRGGLHMPVDGVFSWHDAPEDFELNATVTETREGTKIVAEKAVEAA